MGMTLGEEEVTALKAPDLSKMAEGLDERLSKTTCTIYRVARR